MKMGAGGRWRRKRRGLALLLGQKGGQLLLFSTFQRRAHKGGGAQRYGIALAFLITQRAHKRHLAGQAVAGGFGLHGAVGEGGVHIIDAHIECSKHFVIGQMRGHGAGRGHVHQRGDHAAVYGALLAAAGQIGAVGYAEHGLVVLGAHRLQIDGATMRQAQIVVG